MIKAILFDLDGTIIDSETAAFRAIVESAASWGVAVSDEDAAQIAGKKWDITFDLLQSKYQVPLPRQDMARQIFDRYHQSLKRELIVVPGVVEAIHDLSLQFTMGLVSGSIRRDILYALETLKVLDRFKVVLGAEDYELSKPAPDGYQKAMNALGVKPSETLVFEDSTAGISSGLAAGARVVAVTSTNHFAQNLNGAHASIPNFLSVDRTWMARW